MHTITNYKNYQQTKLNSLHIGYIDEYFVLYLAIYYSLLHIDG